MMKICHITFGFPPTVGGTEVHNYSLVRYLLGRGYDVDVIVLRTSTVSKEALIEAQISINKGIKVHDIHPKRFPFWVFQISKEIKKIERQGKIDVLDIHSTLHILPFIFERRKILTSLHFMELNCPGSAKDKWHKACTYSFKKCWNCSGVITYLKWRLTRWFALRKTMRFMVKYNYLRDLLAKTGIREEKIAVVPHWIDIERINKQAKSLRILSDGFTFAFFGRLSNEKGPDILLNAFAQLTEKADGIKLIFIGDGPLRKELEGFCKDNNLQDRVSFSGAIPHEELFRYLSSAADALVFPHRYFNYEWALLEGMCTEKPIIATDVPATTDILKDGYNALLCEPTPEALTSKMRQILGNPQLGEKIAQNALQTVRERHHQGNLERYEQLVNQMSGG